MKDDAGGDGQAARSPRGRRPPGLHRRARRPPATPSGVSPPPRTRARRSCCTCSSAPPAATSSGGIVGRLTLEAVGGLERELRRKPAAEIAGGVVGLVVGLVVAALLSLALLPLPDRVRVAGGAVRLHRARVARDAAGRGQARGHLRADRGEAAGQRRRRRRARDRHERPDRRARGRPHLDRVRHGHRPAARRCPARAPGDLGLVRPRPDGPAAAAASTCSSSCRSRRRSRSRSSRRPACSTSTPRSSGWPARAGPR